MCFITLMIFSVFYILKCLIQELFLTVLLNVGFILSTLTCISALAFASCEGKFSQLFNHKLPSDITVSRSTLRIYCSGESSIAWNESFQWLFLKDHLQITILQQISSTVLTKLIIVIHWVLCTSCCGTVAFMNGFIENIIANWGKQKLCGIFNSTS